MHIIVGLLVAFAVVAWVAWRRAPMRHCRWRADRRRDRDGLQYFKCAACGAEGLFEGQPDTCARKT